jgi:hypothetical protein
MPIKSQSLIWMLDRFRPTSQRATAQGLSVIRRKLGACFESGDETLTFCVRKVLSLQLALRVSHFALGNGQLCFEIQMPALTPANRGERS